MMDRRGVIGAALASIGSVVMLARNGAAQQPAASHRLALHVDQNDPAVMTMALGNASNAAAYFAERGETVAIELIAYGPGLHMLRADTSPVKARLGEIGKTLPQIVFSGCNNTLQAMQKTEAKRFRWSPRPASFRRASCA
jgi:uncharacterized protein